MEHQLTQFTVDKVTLEADVDVPPESVGLVLFVHGSGSSRHSPRNQYVARTLHERRLGTVLTDLLTASEEQVDRMTSHLRFDIRLLARRVIAILDELRKESQLPFGLFGASTGAAAALVAAAARPDDVGAVVSRGGRPDLAGEALANVAAPTLLIVGGADLEVLELNRRAMKRMRAEVDLEIVPRASHLFEEPGALEQVAALAAAWFLKALRSE
jgi:pimeloyl-ACP methyl ester carboxylesterase